MSVKRGWKGEEGSSSVLFSWEAEAALMSAGGLLRAFYSVVFLAQVRIITEARDGIVRL